MKKLNLLFGLTLAVLILLCAPFAGDKVSAAPATFTVTNTNDSGPGSLRAAIISSSGNNNPDDMDIINFNIPGDDVHVITLLSDLPIIEEAVILDGYSQPGSNPNTKPAPEPMDSTIKIEINGDGKVGNVLAFGDPLGSFMSYGDPSEVRGLSIYGSTGDTIRDLSVGYGQLHMVKILGSYVNVDATGLNMPNRDDPNRDKTGARIGFSSAIGGVNPSDRSILASTGFFNNASVVISYSIGSIKGNFIGVGRDGKTDLGSKSGVETSVWGTEIGGSESGARNVISGNDISNVTVSGHSNAVRGNYIGTDSSGSVDGAITNGIGVVLAYWASDNVVGGVNPGEGNLIAGVSGAGISTTLQDLPYTPATSNWNAFLGNSIHSIGTFDFPGFGTSNLGIDLNGPDVSERQGPSLNDDGDSDDGPNGMINFPVLKTAQQIGDQLTITYDLDVADSPTDEYRVEFFASNVRSIFGYGPGEEFIGAADNVTPGNDKTITLTVDGDYAKKALSATTTVFGYNPAFPSEGDGAFTEYGATSEFSRNIVVGSSTDFDSDGAEDSVEDASPNNGDANYDGIPDRLQPTVTSYAVAGTNTPVTLITEGCSENGRVASIDLASLQKKDNGYEYPYGLTDFILNCSRGDTVNVTMYVHADLDSSQYIPRKFNPNTGIFSDIPGASLSAEVLGSSTVLKLSYSIQDGGPLDDDGEANGVIKDPVGLATESSILTPGQLAKTGFMLVLPAMLALVIVVSAIYTYVDYRKHKKPLIEVDKEFKSNISKEYTYWHHIRVVTIPLSRYRLSVKLERKKVVGKGKVAKGS